MKLVKLANRKVLLRLASVGLVAVCGPLLWSSTGSADPAQAKGWWNQLKPDAALPVPAPPTVQAGELYVAMSPGGPSAYGALRFGGGEASDGKVTVNLGDAPLGPVVLALCPTTKPWTAEDNGAWPAAPTYDCAKKALGDVVGSVVTFNVTEDMAGSDGMFDLALVPDPVTGVVFSTSVRAADSSLWAPSTSTSGTTGGTGSTSTGGTTSGSGSTASSGSGSTASASSGSSGSGSFSSPGAVPAPAGAAPAAGGATTGGAATTAAPGAGGAAAPAAAVDDGNDTAERVGALIVLLLIAAGLWLLSMRSAATGAGAGAAVAAAGTETSKTSVGGIGRFAKPRLSLPNSLA